MKKKSSKYNFAVKRSQQRTNRSVLLVCILFAGLFLGAVAYRYYHQVAPTITANKTSLVAVIKDWFAAHRPHHQQGVSKAKVREAVRNQEPPPIHFEFYKALPNVQVSIAEQEPASNNKKIPKPPAKPKKIEVADADELARELSNAVDQFRKNNSEYTE